MGGAAAALAGTERPGAVPSTKREDELQAEGTTVSKTFLFYFFLLQYYLKVNHIHTSKKEL